MATTRDSVTIPSIFVSPCNSESNSEHDSEQSMLIFSKAQDIAKEVIGRALERTCELDTVESTSSRDSPSVVTSVESQILLKAQEVVQDIENMCLTDSDISAEDVDVLFDVLESKGVFKVVKPDSSLDHVQSLILLKAQEMVSNAIAKAVDMNVTELSDMDAELSSTESQMIMARAKEIVNGVIERVVKACMEEGILTSSSTTDTDDSTEPSLESIPMMINSRPQIAESDYSEVINFLMIIIMVWG